MWGRERVRGAPETFPELADATFAAKRGRVYSPQRPTDTRKRPVPVFAGHGAFMQLFLCGQGRGRTADLPLFRRDNRADWARWPLLDDRYRRCEYALGGCRCCQGCCHRASADPHVCAAQRPTNVRLPTAQPPPVLLSCPVVAARWPRAGRGVKDGRRPPRQRRVASLMPWSASACWK